MRYLWVVFAEPIGLGAKRDKRTTMGDGWG